MSPPTVHPDDTITPDELYPNLQCSVFYRSDVNAHGKTHPSIASADVKKYPVGQSPYSHVMLGMMPGGISSKPRYVYVPEPMTYDEAKAHCIARYGNSSSESNLAHVRSGTEDVLAATAAVGCATEQLSKYECRSDHSGRGRTSVGGQVSLPSLEACAQYCCSYEASCFAFNYEGRTGRCTLMAHRFLPEGRDPLGGHEAAEARRAVARERRDGGVVELRRREAREAAVGRGKSAAQHHLCHSHVDFTFTQIERKRWLPSCCGGACAPASTQR